MRISQKCGILGSLVVGLLAAIPAAQADPYNPSVVNPVPPIAGPEIPTPTQVPGKEYSDTLDKDAAGALDPEQVLFWDGAGGVANSFDYGGDGEVDAIANNADALFFEVIANQAALLFSTEGDAPAPILFESIGGEGGIWATAPEIDANGVNDLDGLEVWGEELVPDADRYSLLGDPGRISVFAFDGATSTSTPFVTALEIATAIGRSDLADIIDLDALMTFGDELLFSIRPVDGFDGGEIWHWDGVNAANFLNHGGHLWDTAFDVSGTFGTASENVDALEAVATTPEPSTLSMIAGAALFGFASRRLRHRVAVK